MSLLNKQSAWIVNVSRAGLVAVTMGISCHAESLLNTGYVNLIGDTTVGVTPSPSSSGQRFLWNPVTETLYIGSVYIGQSISWGSVSLGGNGRGSDSVAVGRGSYGGSYENPDTSVGQVAIGSFSSAIGIYSTALGSMSGAIGHRSIAIGFYAEAVGSGSIALGSGYVDSEGDSRGYAQAQGHDSIAIGMDSGAYGSKSVALNGGSAQANGSFAAGLGSIASGANAVSFGQNEAKAVGSVALGSYNQGTIRKNGTAVNTGSDPGDPIFTLGNGAGYSQRANALIIYRDGTFRIPSLAASGSRFVMADSQGNFGASADGGTLTNLNASALSSGTISPTVLPAEVVQLTSSQVLTNKTLQSSTLSGTTVMGGTDVSQQVVVGATGNLDVAGNINAGGVVTAAKMRVPQSGDLSMGGFTAHPPGLPAL